MIAFNLATYAAHKIVVYKKDRVILHLKQQLKDQQDATEALRNEVNQVRDIFGKRVHDEKLKYEQMIDEYETKLNESLKIPDSFGPFQPSIDEPVQECKEVNKLISKTLSENRNEYKHKASEYSKRNISVIWSMYKKIKE